MHSGVVGVDSWRVASAAKFVSCCIGKGHDDSRELTQEQLWSEVPPRICTSAHISVNELAPKAAIGIGIGISRRQMRNQEHFIMKCAVCGDIICDIQDRSSPADCGCALDGFDILTPCPLTQL
jgi:hypothetical protein